MKLKLLFIVALLMFFGSCKEPKQIDIDTEELIKTVQILSDESYEGRYFSSPGSIKTQEFIKDKFNKLGLQKVIGDDYVQTFTHTFKGKSRHEVFPMIRPKPYDDYSNVKDTTASGANLIGMLKGQTKAL